MLKMKINGIIFVVIIIILIIRTKNKNNKYHVKYHNGNKFLTNKFRTIRIINNMIYKNYKDTSKEVKNHKIIHNIINNKVMYKGAKIPKIYGFNDNLIILEYVGNIDYKQWQKQKPNKKNTCKFKFKIKEFFKLCENKIISHGDLHSENIRLDIDKNGDVKEVYVIDLEDCKLFDSNIIRNVLINNNNNLYRTSRYFAVYNKLIFI
jgi:RIO-like serine/threonine protein kinase